MIREEFSRRFRQVLSGSPTGVPEWTPLLAEGDDAGPYGPHDAPWIVHSDLATLVGGIRALLVQALHPGALAGVVQHSRYEEDVLGRLNGTIRWFTICTFGSHHAIAVESERVRAMHERVRGTYRTAQGQRSYTASDPDLLAWVHLAFTDSFLTVHRLYGKHQVDGSEYVRAWADAVLPLGLVHAPRSESQLLAALADAQPQLRVDDTTRRVVSFIRNDAFSGASRIAYWWLFHAAVDSLPEQHRRALGLRTPPRGLVRAVTRTMLRVMRWGVGGTSPMEQVARARRDRVLQSAGVRGL